ncbi:MAG: hypothetical protein EBR02_08285 [Alphaproteobacteria bacterium]|nr:hypothetical protein [Alphaproteobacteria bacterium]
MDQNCQDNFWIAFGSGAATAIVTLVINNIWNWRSKNNATQSYLKSCLSELKTNIAIIEEYLSLLNKIVTGSKELGAIYSYKFRSPPNFITNQLYATGYLFEHLEYGDIANLNEYVHFMNDLDGLLKTKVTGTIQHSQANDIAKTTLEINKALGVISEDLEKHKKNLSVVLGKLEKL